MGDTTQHTLGSKSLTEILARGKALEKDGDREESGSLHYWGQSHRFVSVLCVEEELIGLHVKQLSGLSAPINGDTVEISTQFQGYRSNNDQQRAALWERQWEQGPY